MLHLSDSGRQFSEATKHLRNDESFEEVRSKSNSQVTEVAEFIEPQYQSLVVRPSKASPL